MRERSENPVAGELQGCPGEPPRIERVFLRAGTRYRVLQGDGMSEPRILERASEVAVVCLALNPGEFGVYARSDGSHIFILFEDELRGLDG